MTELINDPNEITRLAEAFQNVAHESGINTTAPASDTVDLPGGYLFSDGTVATTATVRELNGLDEEAIAKASTTDKAMNVILERGLVSIGEVPLNKVNLDDMLVGDRDAILFGIRQATFGDTYDLSADCISCGETNEIIYSIEDHMTMVTLDNPIEDRVFTVNVKAGEVTLTLPNGLTNKKMLSSTNKSYAELVTDMLSGCIVSVNDEPSMGRQTALSLGMSDRDALAKEIISKAPGPRLSEVSSACKACGNQVRLALSLADLFRI
jgi:hypothetical protein